MAKVIDVLENFIEQWGPTLGGTFANPKQQQALKDLRDLLSWLKELEPILKQKGGSHV